MTRTQLVKSSPEKIPSAPLALDQGRVACVETSRRVNAVSSWLVVFGSDRQPERRLPLPKSVHQLLAYDRKHGLILACSRRSGAPWLFIVDITTGWTAQLGEAPEAYAAVLRSAQSGWSALATLDPGGRDGWDLYLTNGKTTVGVSTGPGHALMPVWSPDGKSLVFLSDLREEKE
jgi:hypothetical protein